jgi:DNA-binding MarR family transcriptional regulator
MEVAGLIRREPDPNDGHSNFAEITREGRKLARNARLSHHQELRRTFAEALDDRDVADLTRIMGRIAAAAGSNDPGDRNHRSVRQRKLDS